MARERTVKYPPKRGNLKRSEMRRVVREVVHARRSREEAAQTPHAATIKVGRDVKTGRFISCPEAERRKTTAVVETIKRPKKKK